MTGQDFKARRERLGWTQKTTGEALGLSVNQIRAIENNRSGVTATVAILFDLITRQTYDPHHNSPSLCEKK